MSLATRLSDLATRIGAEVKATRAAAGTPLGPTTADQAAVGTALTTITGLSATIPAGAGTWEIEWLVPYVLTSGTATLGVNVVATGLTLNAAPSRYFVEGSSGAPATGAAAGRSATAAIGTAVASGQLGATASTTAAHHVRVTATIVTTAASAGGTVALQMNASANNTLVPKAGARGTLRKLA